MRKKLLLLFILVLVMPASGINANDVQRSVITAQTALNIEQLASLEIGDEKTVWDIAFSTDGRLLAIAESEQSVERIGTVRLWDTETLRELVVPVLNQLNAITIDFSPNGKLLAAAGRTGEIFLVDIEEEKIVKTLTVNNQGINAIAFSPDGQLLASANNTTISDPSEENDQTAFELINIEFGDVMLSAISMGEEFNPGSGLAATFSPNGKYVAVGQGGNVVQVWDLETKELIHFIKAGSIGIYSLTFSPDSRLLIAGDGNGKVIQWDVESGEKQLEFEGGMQWDSDVIFSPDGSLIATTGNDSNIHIFDTKTQEEVTVLKGHTASLISLAFSPDGTLLASGGTDGTVRLWGVPADS
jgi:WD40 repeat protein